MRAPLFITIGVHKPDNMDPLPGVLESVDGMTAWASQHGYDTIQFDDRAGPVLADRIKDRLTPLKSDGYSRDGALLLDRPRIMVYFCGHGLHAPGDQYWVLTPGPDQPAHRISADTFQDVLATYAPKQVGVISDACNVPKAVIGTAVAPVDPYTGQARPVQRDTFRSSQEGKPSFAVPAKNGAPPYCIFTSVLLTALSTPQPDALSPVYLRFGESKVSSDSLATYLEATVPDAALDVGKLQDPVCNPGFRAFDDVYVEFPSAPPDTAVPDSGPDPGPPPDKGLPQMASLDLDDPAQKLRINRSQSEWRRPYIEDLAKRVQAFKDNHYPERTIGHLFVSQDTGGTPLPEPRMIDSQGICSAEESPFFAYPTWITKSRKGFFDTGRSSTLIVQSGPFSCAAVMHHMLWSAVLFGNRGDIPGGHGGVELLAWGHGGRPDLMPNRQEAALSAAEALKGLSNGTLQARDIPALARDMRYMKHADPMFGIVPAYLYASVGDLENIYRMCTYYLWHDQDVPFDIALLSGLPLISTDSGGFCIEVPKVDEVPEKLRAPDMPDFIWRKTPATRVAVAGITPTLRLGWQKLGNAEHAVHQRLFELSEYLTESPVATLYGHEAGQKLIAIFREQQS